MSSYFSHDSNARHDPKIMSVRAEFNGDVRPYAWFFMILEIMREHESDGYRIKFNRQAKRGICMDLSITMDELDLFIQSAIDVKLLSMDDEDYLYSDSFLTRMSIKDEIRQKRSMAAKRKHELAQGKAPEKPEDDDTTVDLDIFNAWNSTPAEAQLTRHVKLSPKMRSKIRSARKEGYTNERIIEAISNYAECLIDPRAYYFDYKWDLIDFLSRGLSKFANKNWKTNFARTKNHKYTEQGGDDVKFGR